MIITFTTVGYGDVYAITTFGRLTTYIIAVSGTVMISLLVATMSTHLKLDPLETRVLNGIQEEALAAEAIQHSLQY
jgi:voltage-gated potassium channel Kch